MTTLIETPTSVRISREDIEHGVPCDGMGEKGGCMVWRGFNRALGNRYSHFHVLPSKVWAWESIGHTLPDVVFVLPEWVGTHIREFDQGEKPRPFSFEVLGVPDV